MEDVTDIGFRSLCKRFGAAMVYTEFVSAEALVRDVKSTIDKLTIADEERPVGIQLYGRDVEAMVEAARIVEQARPDVIDLNFGCPVKKVAGKGAGAGMLQNIPKLLDITRRVVDAVKLPVTVKTRLGWNSEQLIITTLAEQLQDCGIQALTIHGRTRAQMYTGEADWTLIGEVKNNPRITIPIIGNGDIKTPEDARRAFDRYGVDAVMVGRATFGAPGRTVCMFCGDGGFQMNLQELGTIMEQQTPVKMILLNNHYLGNVRQWQDMFWNRRKSFTKMLNPCYELIAQGYGIAYEAVTDRAQLKAAVGRMLAAKGPYLLECAIKEDDDVLPMTPPGKSVEEMMLDIKD